MTKIKFKKGDVILDTDGRIFCEILGIHDDCYRFEVIACSNVKDFPIGRRYTWGITMANRHCKLLGQSLVYSKRCESWLLLS